MVMHGIHETDESIFIYKGKKVSSSRNGDITYFLDDESSKTFSIDRRTGRVTLKAPLDYEEKQNWEVIYHNTCRI